MPAPNKLLADKTLSSSAKQDILDAILGEISVETNIIFVEYMVSVGAKLDGLFHSIFAAVENPDINILKYYLDHGVSANTQLKHIKRTVLMSAARLLDLDKIKLLVKHGAKINEEDILGFNALMYPMTSYGHGDFYPVKDDVGKLKIVVRYLIDAGIDVNHVSKDNETAITLANKIPAPEVVKMLKAAGAKR